MPRLTAPICTAPVREGNFKTWQTLGRTEHFVQFYRTDDYLVDCLASYLAKGMLEGRNALVIATADHRIAVEERLRSKNVDVAAGVVSGHYVALDAAEMLTKFMRRGRPDRQLFQAVVGDVMRRLAADGRGVCAFGEMVALLWRDDQREAAIELENLWNEARRRHEFSLFCAYPADCAINKPGRPGIEDICQAHSCSVALTP